MKDQIDQTTADWDEAATAFSVSMQEISDAASDFIEVVSAVFEAFGKTAAQVMEDLKEIINALVSVCDIKKLVKEKGKKFLCLYRIGKKLEEKVERCRGPPKNEIWNCIELFNYH